MYSRCELITQYLKLKKTGISQHDCLRKSIHKFWSVVCFGPQCCEGLRGTLLRSLERMEWHRYSRKINTNTFNRLNIHLAKTYYMRYVISVRRNILHVEAGTAVRTLPLPRFYLTKFQIFFLLQEQRPLYTSLTAQLSSLLIVHI